MGIVLLTLAVAVSALYHLTALLAALRHLQQPRRTAEQTPGISILKPVHGLDPGFLDAIRSHANQRYAGEFEILFGLNDPGDPSRAAMEQLKREFPQLPIRILEAQTRWPNAKVGVLRDLAEAARFPVLIVNDADILVPPDYLTNLVAELQTPGVGIVTCLYRASAASLPGQWEALGIATDFAPSVLVAPLVGIREFGLGATLCFRRTDLNSIGGFAAIADYLADDYQLAKHITSQGSRALLSRVTVETSLGDGDWRSVWKHQVRWARTIRVSRGDGYLGLPVTHAGLWALLAMLAGAWWLASVLIALRWLSALAAGGGVLSSRHAQRWFWLAPVWDLWAFAVWVAGLAGGTVEWRGMQLRLDRSGKIQVR